MNDFKDLVEDFTEESKKQTQAVLKKVNHIGKNDPWVLAGILAVCAVVLGFILGRSSSHTKQEKNR